MTHTIEVNFHRDWLAYIRNDMKSKGIDPGAIKTDKELVYGFLNLRDRTISAVPRKVLKARTFECPPVHRDELKLIEEKIRLGLSLNSHLSRSLNNPGYNDGLINDWGIFHLHLGTKSESDGFVNRTKEILFARFDRENAYLIAMHPHGKSVAPPWSLQNMVRAVHENWPESIAIYRFNGALRLSRNHDDHGHAFLRSANVNRPVEVAEGVIYMMLGGGITTSGLSGRVVQQADYFSERLAEMQQWVIDHIEVFTSFANAKKIIHPRTLQFGLKVKGNRVFTVEINTMITWPLGDF